MGLWGSFLHSWRVLFSIREKQMVKIHVIDYANIKCTCKRFTVELKNPVRSYAFFHRCFYRPEGGGLLLVMPKEYKTACLLLCCAKCPSVIGQTASPQPITSGVWPTHGEQGALGLCPHCHRSPCHSSWLQKPVIWTCLGTGLAQQSDRFRSLPLPTFGLSPCSSMIVREHWWPWRLGVPIGPHLQVQILLRGGSFPPLHSVQ